LTARNICNSSRNFSAPRNVSGTLFIPSPHVAVVTGKL
jgi:hypothetical protein